MSYAGASRRYAFKVIVVGTDAVETVLPVFRSAGPAHRHIGGFDCARALEAAAKMIEDGALSKPLKEPYAKWDSLQAQKMLRGELKLGEIAALVEREDINPEPKSGRQEYLENVVNRYV